MTFTLGVFELFTYAVPGAMQMAFLLYVASRLDLVSLSNTQAVPGLLLGVAFAIASYLLGHLTYLISRLVGWLFRRRDNAVDAWVAVAADAAKSGTRTVPQANPWLLLAAIDLQNREVAIEIARFRATGLMLRNATVPCFCGMLAALAELAVGSNRWLAGGLSVLFAAAVAGFAVHGRTLRYWAYTKTYQIAYWLDLPLRPATAAEST